MGGNEGGYRFIGPTASAQILLDIFPPFTYIRAWPKNDFRWRTKRLSTFYPLYPIERRLNGFAIGSSLWADLISHSLHHPCNWPANRIVPNALMGLT
jgi:hypothetical protein